MAELLGLRGSWHLALDRTQGSRGKREINYLVLRMVTRRFRVPLIWTVLDGGGNSDTTVRTAPMRRYLRHFAPLPIRLVLAGRSSAPSG